MSLKLKFSRMRFSLCDGDMNVTINFVFLTGFQVEGFYPLFIIDKHLIYEIVSLHLGYNIESLGIHKAQAGALRLLPCQG